MVSSSIWGEALHVRVVWVTMLALCDERGNVKASPRGLARMANVTPELCFDALHVLSSADTDSRDPHNDGRRIERNDQGFRILNYAKYRGYATSTERSRKHRATEGTRATFPSASSSDLDLDLDDPDPELPDRSDQPGAGAPRVLQPSSRTDALGYERSGIYEPPTGPRSHFVPDDWVPKPYQVAECSRLGLEVDALAAAFRTHEFERAYSNWDKAFDRWIAKEASIRAGKPKRAQADPMEREDDESHDDHVARRDLGMTRPDYRRWLNNRRKSG